MIADLKPYPEMKDSGVPRLGEVPEHWEAQQLGRIGRFWKGNGGTKENEIWYAAVLMRSRARG